MSITKTLFGTSRQIPENEEEGWGTNTTNLLADQTDGVNAGFMKSGANVLQRESIASSTLAAAATLTQTAMTHRIQGSGGAVTLSATTPIAAGVQDGQKLTLEGAHATNTVTIPGGSDTTALNGDIVLGLYHRIKLIWNATAGKWLEDGARSH